MIAIKLEQHVNHLAVLAQRGNGDLNERITPVLDSMRLEIERLKGFEAVAVLTMPADNQEKDHVRG